MNLKYDELLSNFAFKGNLRQYNKAHKGQAFDFVFVGVKTYALAAVKADLDEHGVTAKIAILVGRCRLTPG